MNLFAGVGAAAVLDAAESAFGAALESGVALHVRDVRVGDQHVRLELAGDEALARFVVPFSVFDGAGREPDLTLRAWDAASGARAALTAPTLVDARCLEPRALFADAGTSGRGVGCEEIDGHARHQVFWEPFWVFGFDLATRRAWFSCPAVRELPDWSFAHPFLKLLHPWLRTRGLHVVHAGAVGTQVGCALLVGRGGAGKSTLSIAAGMAGLEYLGDDYVAVRIARAAAPRAFGMYRIAKLATEHMRSVLPEAQRHVLVEAARDPSTGVGATPVKAQLVMPVARPEGLDVVAIVLPELGGREGAPTSVGAGEALRALAPSTLFQLPGYPEDLGALGGLARRVPAWRLALGNDLGQAVERLRYLASGGGQ